MSALGRSRQVRSQESGFHRCRARLANPATTTRPNGARTGQTARKTSPPTSSSTTSKRSRPGGRSKSLLEVGAAVVHGRLGTECADRLELGVAPGQSRRGTAEAGGDLDGRGADAPGGGGDEDAVGWAEPCHLHERDPRRQVVHRDRGVLLDRKAGDGGQRLPRRHHDLLRIRPVLRADDDPVADRASLDAGAEQLDRAGRLHAGRVRASAAPSRTAPCGRGPRRSSRRSPRSAPGPLPDRASGREQCERAAHRARRAGRGRSPSPCLARKGIRRSASFEGETDK